ncbi:esterase FE4-like [Zophobas morio]|uniref:esterase FE4-like n=1 Tax=Zophobas morio TaxID=2755281 RepID=UPI0030831DCA
MLLEALILVGLKYVVVATLSVKITTPLGDILGSTALKSRLGRTIYSFRGIRYAEAPINSLRFQPPVPTGKWSGVYNATVDGPACPQVQQDGVTIPTSEDCLFLNIYTTKPPSVKNTNKLPVLVFIHGGAYVSGTARSDMVGPRFLLDQDIVLATLNYRIGALGFLSLGKDVPGNNGLKDQVVALQWIKKYIHAFGGDPNSITLSGSSVGGGSVNYHLLSPMSRGLFHRAIFSCYSAENPREMSLNGCHVAQKQARFVGCPDDTPGRILDCLRTKSAEEIVKTLPRFLEFGKNPLLTYTPVIEKDYGQQRFIIEHPVKSIVNNNFQELPVLVGVTQNEFAFQTLNLILNKTLRQELNTNFEKWAPVIFGYERHTEKSKNISRTIRQFYLGDGRLTLLSLIPLGEAFADGITGFAVNRAVDLISNKSSCSVYYYKFTYQKTNAFGVFHAEDILYLFDVPIQNRIYDSKMIEIMTSLWTNFAKHADPNEKSSVYPIWRPYNVDTKLYLDIGQELVLRNHLFEERYALWRRLFPVELYL